MVQNISRKNKHYLLSYIIIALRGFLRKFENSQENSKNIGGENSKKIRKMRVQKLLNYHFAGNSCMSPLKQQRLGDNLLCAISH